MACPDFPSPAMPFFRKYHCSVPPVAAQKTEHSQGIAHVIPVVPVIPAVSSPAVSARKNRVIENLFNRVLILHNVRPYIPVHMETDNPAVIGAAVRNRLVIGTDK